MMRLMMRLMLRLMTSKVQDVDKDDVGKNMAQHPNCLIPNCSPCSTTFMFSDFDSNVVAILRGDDVSCWVTQSPMKR